MPADIIIVADARRLKRVIEDLLTNAWKYGAQEFTIDAEHRSGEVLVSLTETVAEYRKL